MNLGSRRQSAQEERQRIAELEEYFADNPWRYGVVGERRKKRKLFQYEHFQFFRPEWYKEVYV